MLRVFKNRTLRRISESTTDEKVHNEELHSLYHLPNLVTVIKSTILKWAENVARMKVDKSAFKNFKRLNLQEIDL